MSKFAIALVCVVAVILALPLVISAMSGPKSSESAPVPAASPPPVVAPPAPVAAPVVPGAGPAIVTSTPINGATNVDPRITEIRVTFNVPMGGGFSWTGGGANFPSGPPGAKPYWTPDRKTCVLPVALKPNWSYRFGLNSPSHRNFKSADGVALTPTVFTFSTSVG
ncbi:MAG: Ig-like domain-containing protein [Candidatus Hydrogenedentes bacterium]|nr:Ig-like domain-containing protein [Candidatus Hydrogenedentota bacterium]